jgi:hypothetical protein
MQHYESLFTAVSRHWERRPSRVSCPPASTSGGSPRMLNKTFPSWMRSRRPMLPIRRRMNRKRSWTGGTI